jgi:hypothetical protein
MVSMLKVNLGIDSGYLWSIEQVSNELEWILIFPSDGIKAMEIHAEPS